MRCCSEFRFVPDARLDDLMISWASDGGGVGAHVDSYDVFLLQASGRRRWRIARRYDATLDERAPLKVLRRFVAEQEFVLEPGDLLYLPPHWAHEGTAVGGDCMTCSIGMRAPQRGSLAAELVQRLAEVSDDPLPYRDAHQPATATPAAIPHALAAFAAEAVRRLATRPSGVARALGEVLSEPKPQVWFEKHRDAMAKPRRRPRPAHADALRRRGTCSSTASPCRPAAQTPPCCAASPTTARSTRARCAARADRQGAARRVVRGGLAAHGTQ